MTNDTEPDWRRNGIMVPYGFVLWALRDAMRNPSSAEDVLDEFLRAEFETLGDAMQRQVLDLIYTHLSTHFNHSPHFNDMIQTRKVTIWKPLYEHLLGLRIK